MSFKGDGDFRAHLQVKTDLGNLESLSRSSVLRQRLTPDLVESCKVESRMAESIKEGSWHPQSVSVQRQDPGRDRGRQTEKGRGRGEAQSGCEDYKDWRAGGQGN